MDDKLNRPRQIDNDTSKLTSIKNSATYSPSENNDKLRAVEILSSSVAQPVDLDVVFSASNSDIHNKRRQSATYVSDKPQLNEQSGGDTAVAASGFDTAAAAETSSERNTEERAPDVGVTDESSNVDTDLRRMNALKVKRSQTEAHGSRDRSTSDGGWSRRHSIQFVPAPVVMTSLPDRDRLDVVAAALSTEQINGLEYLTAGSSSSITPPSGRRSWIVGGSVGAFGRRIAGGGSSSRSSVTMIPCLESQGSRSYGSMMLPHSESSSSLKPTSSALGPNRKLKKLSCPTPLTTSSMFSSRTSRAGSGNATQVGTGTDSVNVIANGSGRSSVTVLQEGTALSFSVSGSDLGGRKKSFRERGTSSLDALKASMDFRRKSFVTSSCEFFTLKFETNDDTSSTDVQTLPALKDYVLGQMLVGPLEQRGLAADAVEVFLESSNTPLPLSSACYCLAGNVLHVRAKDEARQLPCHHQKSSSYSAGWPSSSSSLSAQPSINNKQMASNGGNLRSKRNGSSATVASSGDECNTVLPADGSPYATLTRGTAAFAAGLGLDPASKNRSLKTTGPRIQALFSPFAKAQDKQELLNEILTGYTATASSTPGGGHSRNPSTASSSSIGGSATQSSPSPAVTQLSAVQNGDDDQDEHQFILESSWTDIVVDHQTLDKRQRDHQEAMWELLTTEIDYIHKLRVVIDLFMCCLLHLQADQLLTEIDANKLFSNIGEVYTATCNFWTNYLYTVIEHSRKTGELLNSNLLKSGFLVFDKIFEPYTRYCLEQEMCRDYIKAKTSENEIFRLFLMWCESQKQCGRLKLADLLVKPWQRLTRYKLLLYAMRTPLDKMDASVNLAVEEQIGAIDAAINVVERFVHGVNLALRQRQDHHQLSLATDRIESYDVIEPPNDECTQFVSEFCKLDLNCSVPGCGPQELRSLILEGGLRLKDTYAKTDVYCFLFTDMFLVTKCVAKRSDKVKVIKPPMRLDKVVVHGLRDPASFMMLYLNEYNVAQSVYIFYGDTKTWLDSISKAQAEYRLKRSQHLTRLESATFDLYAEVDIDSIDDDRYSPTERPSSRLLNNGVGTAYGLRRTDSGSSSTSSVDRSLPPASVLGFPAAPSDATEASPSAPASQRKVLRRSDNVFSRRFSRGGGYNEDELTDSDGGSTAATHLTLVDEAADDPVAKYPNEVEGAATTTAATSIGELKRVSASEPVIRPLSTTAASADEFQHRSSSIPIGRESSSPDIVQASSSSCELPVFSSAVSTPTSSASLTASAKFVVGDATPVDQLSSASSSLSQYQTVDRDDFDAADEVPGPIRTGFNFGRSTSVGNVLSGLSDRRVAGSRRSVSVAVADDPVGSTIERATAADAQNPRLPPTTSPMSCCRIDREIVLNNTALETSEV